MCAVQGWGGVCTRRGEIQPAQGEFRGGIKTANTPPWPAGVQRFDSMKRTPRVVIPPPYIEAPKKCKTGVFITSPNRAPAETQRSGFGGKRTSDRERESCRLRRDEGFVVRSDDSQHRICLVCGEAAALPNALGGVWPHTPKLRAEAHTHAKLRAFLRKRFYPPPAAQLQRGTSPPLRNPQLSEGTREIISERSLIMKKDIKFSTRMASADREKIKTLAAKAHMSMSDYVTACCLGKRIVVIDEQKELLRQLKGIGGNINRLTVLANMGKVQVIGLEKAAGELSEVSAALRAVMEGR